MTMFAILLLALDGPIYAPPPMRYTYVLDFMCEVMSENGQKFTLNGTSSELHSDKPNRESDWDQVGKIQLSASNNQDLNYVYQVSHPEAQQWNLFLNNAEGIRHITLFRNYDQETGVVVTSVNLHGGSGNPNYNGVGFCSKFRQTLSFGKR
jgi:hypothetical protein